MKASVDSRKRYAKPGWQSAGHGFILRGIGSVGPPPPPSAYSAYSAVCSAGFGFHAKTRHRIQPQPLAALLNRRKRRQPRVQISLCSPLAPVPRLRSRSAFADYGNFGREKAQEAHNRKLLSCVSCAFSRLLTSGAALPRQAIRGQRPRKMHRFEQVPREKSRHAPCAELTMAP